MSRRHFLVSLSLHPPCKTAVLALQDFAFSCVKGPIKTRIHAQSVHGLLESLNVGPHFRPFYICQNTKSFFSSQKYVATKQEAIRFVLE